MQNQNFCPMRVNRLALQKPETENETTVSTSGKANMNVLIQSMFQRVGEYILIEGVRTTINLCDNICCEDVEA